MARTSFAIVGSGSFVVDESGQVEDTPTATGTLSVGIGSTRSPNVDLWAVTVHGPGDYTSGRAVSLAAEIETTARVASRSTCGADPFGSLILYRRGSASRGRLVLTLCGKEIVFPRATLRIEPIDAAASADLPQP